ncbi:hypothetical protein I7I48_05898 [Histoplasma ohiense]|nr:hypothetical protein I7I48_05898 [Histoplasma ohiense (nom. inval.)]
MANHYFCYCIYCRKPLEHTELSSAVHRVPTGQNHGGRVFLEPYHVATMSRLPPSPPPEPALPEGQSSHSSEPVPLDAEIRTTPIHHLLPEIRVPSDPLPAHRYHPITCTPLDAVEYRAQLQSLRKEYSTSVAAVKGQEEMAREIRRRMKEAEEKRENLHKLMKRKTEERETERRVFQKIKREREGKA